MFTTYLCSKSPHQRVSTVTATKANFGSTASAAAPFEAAAAAATVIATATAATAISLNSRNECCSYCRPATVALAVTVATAEMSPAIVGAISIASDAATACR